MINIGTAHLILERFSSLVSNGDVCLYWHGPLPTGTPASLILHDVPYPTASIGLGPPVLATQLCYPGRWPREYSCGSRGTVSAFYDGLSPRPIDSGDFYGGSDSSVKIDFTVQGISIFAYLVDPHEKSNTSLWVVGVCDRIGREQLLHW